MFHKTLAEQTRPIERRWKNIELVKIIPGGIDKFGKFVFVKYSDGTQEKVYVTGPKVDKNRVENLEKKYPGSF